jgi:hypothetical protein
VQRLIGEFEVGSVHVGAGDLFLIAGPCVIESEAHAMKMAEAIHSVTRDLAIPYIFKASYDKANRTSLKSFRGPGVREGTRILRKIAETHRVPVLTDIHEPEHAEVVAEAADVLQIPAFLCRQTDLLVAAAVTGIELGGAVHPDALAFPATLATDNGDVDGAIDEWSDAPRSCRRVMAQERPLAARQDRGVLGSKRCKDGERHQ